MAHICGNVVMPVGIGLDSHPMVARSAGFISTVARTRRNGRNSATVNAASRLGNESAP
jgi:hypothetical protein